MIMMREKKTSPAKWAGGVGQEPCVYATKMESMAAHGEKSKLVIRLKLTQTHSTVKRVFQANDSFVEEDGESVYAGLVYTRIMQMEKLLELALEDCHIIV